MGDSSSSVWAKAMLFNLLAHALLVLPKGEQPGDFIHGEAQRVCSPSKTQYADILVRALTPGGGSFGTCKQATRRAMTYPSFRDTSAGNHLFDSQSLLIVSCRRSRLGRALMEPSCSA